MHARFTRTVHILLPGAGVPRSLHRRGAMNTEHEIRSSKESCSIIYTFFCIIHYIHDFLCPLSVRTSLLGAIVSSIARISINDIDEVPRNPSLRLLTRVELVVPKVAVWVTDGRAVAARDAAVMVVSVDLEGCRAVQKLSWILMYI